MTRIRATCPTCGEIDLRPSDVRLTLEHDVFGDLGEDSCYRFVCPACADEVVKPVDERIAELLRTGGVAVDEPSCPTHPEDPPGGPRLSFDDLIALHELLETETWFSELESMVR